MNLYTKCSTKMCLYSNFALGPKGPLGNYCIVDKSSSEQNICDSTFISFIVRPIIVAQVCLTAGRQTGNQTDKYRCMYVDFKIIIIKIIKFPVAKIHRLYQSRIKYLILCFFNVNYSVTNTFSWLFLKSLL